MSSATLDTISPEQWWPAAERAFIGQPPALAPEGALAEFDRLHQAELAFDLARAQASLDRLAGETLPGDWATALDLLRLRVRVRRGSRQDLDLARKGLSELLAAIPESRPATLARAYHLLAVIALRQGDQVQAEAAFTRALERVDDAPAKVWVLDGFGQLFMASGAWEEARRTLRRVSELKEAMGDPVGRAITSGHLARLELQLGDPAAAHAAADAALRSGEERLSRLSRVRLLTLLLEASIASGDSARRQADRAELERALVGSQPESHYLYGFACVAVARAAFASEDGQAPAWLSRAAGHFSLPEHLALLRYWEGRLVAGLMDDAGWLAELERLFQAASGVPEAEVLLHTYLAQRAAQRGDRGEMRSRLLTAARRAGISNNALLVEEVDRVCAELAPADLSERLVERYTGRPAAELRKTVREEVSIVFADLVGFTPRAVQLSPDEIMATARSLFELSAPVLSRHAMQPTNYQGDGLLAVARGEGHQTRAVDFAVELVRKSQRVTLVRSALGERWGLQLRAGVAAGPMVLGTLGSYHKTEFAVIGLAANLASRLQGVAEPGQIVCAGDHDPGGASVRESVQLKGFDHPIDVSRVTVGR